MNTTRRRTTAAAGRRHSSNDANLIPARRTAAVPPQRPPDDVEDAEAPELSAKVARLVEDIRAPFTAFVDGFVTLGKSRAQLAPKFMRAFHAWAEETGGSFVNFVRTLDDTVPEDRDGYRKHQTYQAADYLRRLVMDATRPEAERSGERPTSPVAVIAMLLKSMLPVVDNIEEVYSIFRDQLHWTPGQVERLQARVEESPPLLTKQGQERKLHPVTKVA